MPFPPTLEQWKVTATWTSPAADGGNTISYTYRTMALSSADCLTKAGNAFTRMSSISPVTYNTPSRGW
jgi:hypothetical protein